MSARIVHNAMHRWQEEVEEARSTHEVLATVQDFVDHISAGDLAQLPEDCRPRSIANASDIDAFNLCLAEAVKASWGTNQNREVLTEVAQLFLRASVKVSRLNGATPAA
jgi:hypothetical protein